MNTTLANDASCFSLGCVFTPTALRVRTTGDVSNTYESMLDRALTNNNATQIVSGARGAWNDADMLEVTTHNLVVVLPLPRFEQVVLCWTSRSATFLLSLAMRRAGRTSLSGP